MARSDHSVDPHLKTRESLHVLYRYVEDYLVISTGEDFICAEDLRRCFSDALAMGIMVEEPLRG